MNTVTAPPSRATARRPRVQETIRYAEGMGPIGPIFVALSDTGVCALRLADSERPGSRSIDRLARDFPGAALEADPAALGHVFPRVVAHILSGRPCDDLPLDLRGTPFQLRVWEALRAIPWGETRSYAELAVALGMPAGAARAVGSACGTNLISLIVPCHRVLRTGGALGGYYWGLDRKARLLDLERGVVA